MRWVGEREDEALALRADLPRSAARQQRALMQLEPEEPAPGQRAPVDWSGARGAAGAPLPF